MASTNLGSMQRGDNKTVQFTIPNANLPPGGVVAFSFWFTAKQQVSDLDASAQWQKVGTPGALGPFTITSVGSPSVGGVGGVDAVITCDLLPGDTNALPDFPVVLQWDFQVKDASARISTANAGTLTVVPDVTRAS